MKKECEVYKEKISTFKYIFLYLCVVFFLLPFEINGHEQTIQAKKIIFGCYSESIEEFEDFAKRAKLSGATHIILTAEDLPWARWQYDTPGDPYPSWAISNVGLLKIATPEALKPYIPQDYAHKVLNILRERCKVLRKHNLKGAFKTFEPQMLPREVYEDNPLWMGPQVDNLLRSAVPRFAPSIDNPEVVKLYEESVKILLENCPEIEIISIHTNDSGAGMSWSQGLYPGKNGNTIYNRKTMYERYHDFFNIFLETAEKMGHNLEMDAQWVREDYPELFARELKSGMALKNYEGPDATRYKNTVGFLLDYFYIYYPVQGIPFAMRFLNELSEAYKNPAPRLFVMMGDRYNKELYFDIYDRFIQNPVTKHIEILEFLKDLAVEYVGNENSDLLLDVWRNLYDIQKHGRMVNWGGYWFYIGSVHQRWLTRPFVPFPMKLTKEEKSYWRPFLFQAQSEKRAMSMHDIQGTLVFSGYGGFFYHGRIFSYLKNQISDARKKVNLIKESNPDLAGQFELLNKRLYAFHLIMENCVNAVSYQYYLNLIDKWDLKRKLRKTPNLVAIPEFNRIRDYARSELDNTAALIRLLESTTETILHTASTKEEEDIRILGPDLKNQLRKKLIIMLNHWEEHEELFFVE